MKTVKNRELYYCDNVKRCVVHYSGMTPKKVAFKSCSHIDPQACQDCDIYKQCAQFILDRKKMCIPHTIL